MGIFFGGEMGQQQSNPNQGDKDKDKNKEKPKYEPPPPTRIGKKKKRVKGASPQAYKLPTVTPSTRCRLRLLKLDRVKDYLLMEQEFIQIQEQHKPQEEKAQEERSKVDDLRGSPMIVGTLDEIVDDNHAIASSSVGPKYYVTICS